MVFFNSPWSNEFDLHSGRDVFGVALVGGGVVVVNVDGGKVGGFFQGFWEQIQMEHNYEICSLGTNEQLS